MINLMHGDCLELMRDIPDASIDLTITSPPYDDLREYNGSCKSWTFEKCKKIIETLYRVTKIGGSVVWIVADATRGGSESLSSFRQAIYFNDCGFLLSDTMIWDKGGFSAVGSIKHRYPNVFEYMFVFTKGKTKYFLPIRDRKNKNAGSILRSSTKRLPCGNTKPIYTNGYVYKELGIRYNIWSIPPVTSSLERTVHPAQYPVALASDHIISWCNKDALVLDPFMGSGLTGVACINTGRNFIGIEQDAEYFEIAKNRIARAEHDKQAQPVLIDFENIPSAPEPTLF